jgi:hypothetical protein
MVAMLHYPEGAALDCAGILSIVDRYNSHIRTVDSKTWIIGAIAGTGSFGSGARHADRSR